MSEANKQNDIWIFAYGSLMWRPDFPVSQGFKARLHGYIRDFCLTSVVHRGTKENPGLVLALDHAQDENAYCDGVIFQIKPGEEEQSLKAIRAREQMNKVYLEVIRPVTILTKLDDSPPGDHTPSQVDAFCLVVDQNHRQYCPGLTNEQKAEIILKSHGGAGPNINYLINTAAHLKSLNIKDPILEDIMNWVEKKKQT